MEKSRRSDKCHHIVRCYECSCLFFWIVVWERNKLKKWARIHVITANVSFVRLCSNNSVVIIAVKNVGFAEEKINNEYGKLELSRALSHIHPEIEVFQNLSANSSKKKKGDPATKLSLKKSPRCHVARCNGSSNEITRRTRASNNGVQK